jgi:hypothetical protein
MVIVFFWEDFDSVVDEWDDLYFYLVIFQVIVLIQALSFDLDLYFQ